MCCCFSLVFFGFGFLWIYVLLHWIEIGSWSFDGKKQIGQKDIYVKHTRINHIECGFTDWNLETVMMLFMIAGSFSYIIYIFLQTKFSHLPVAKQEQDKTEFEEHGSLYALSFSPIETSVQQTTIGPPKVHQI